ncbi:MAG: hypothetical protein KBD78_09415 [Oligoflexales bacterium]|nr:hypothetical protein [Oligoflexales bacterium]
MKSHSRNLFAFLNIVCVALSITTCGRKPSIAEPQPIAAKKVENKNEVKKAELQNDNADSSAQTKNKTTSTEKSVDIDLDAAVFSDSGAYKVLVQWQTPLRAGGSGNNVAQFLFFSKDNFPVKQVRITEFHPRMPAMGHGTDESTQVVSYDTDKSNLVEVSGIFFNMPGDATTWVVTLVVVIEERLEKFELLLPEVN